LTFVYRFSSFFTYCISWSNWRKEYDKNKDKNKTDVASAEAARRYYSVKEFLKSGANKAYTPILPPREDKKFFDNQNKKPL
jgi:hypothetical protein